jgi:hypothetical protein
MIRFFKAVLSAEMARRAKRQAVKIERARQGLCPECGEDQCVPTAQCCAACLAKVVPFI